MSDSTPCDCPLAGWCPRHKFTTSLREFELCRTRAEYFDLFASGNAPQHHREAKARGLPPPRRSRLPLGDWIAKGIEVATFGKVKPCGGCSKRKRKLNEIGEAIAETFSPTKEPAK